MKVVGIQPNYRPVGLDAMEGVLGRLGSCGCRCWGIGLRNHICGHCGAFHSGAPGVHEMIADHEVEHHGK
jgi:hypothetical protein